MSIESDAQKWKNSVAKIRGIDSDGVLLTPNVREYFDEVASVFEKGVFDPENVKKRLRVLRTRNTRLSGKPIAVELSSFVNVTERYATKIENDFLSFAKMLRQAPSSVPNHNASVASVSLRESAIPNTSSSSDELDELLAEQESLDEDLNPPFFIRIWTVISKHLDFERPGILVAILVCIWTVISNVWMFHFAYNNDDVSAFWYITFCWFAIAPLAGSVLLVINNLLHIKVITMALGCLGLGIIVSIVDYFVISEGILDYCCDLIEIGFGYFAIPLFFFMKLILDE